MIMFAAHDLADTKLFGVYSQHSVVGVKPSPTTQELSTTCLTPCELWCMAIQG
eukprot:m.15466 g.15466  ORF g.15466 m.15466 type:complete len:53 (+) comp6628_c0_seq1:53-211(+)